MQLVGAVDQGTSSSRFLIFDSQTSTVVTQHQIELKQKFPQEGWVEEDPLEILDSVKSCISTAVGNLADLGLDAADIKCVGVTNQGATTIVWDKVTGCPLYNAIVWLDTRTASTASDLVDKTPDKSIDHLRPLCGLPINACFSAVKLHWLLENSEAVCQAVQENRCLFGTVDSWLLWNLTGGINGGRHVTDVTNAGITMLMNLKTLQWDEELCSFFGVPKSILPEICSSSEIYGEITSGPLQHVPLSGILLDQQSAMVGQRCFSVGQAKNTYGTGCYLNFNTGAKPVESKTGMMTMVAYKFGPSQPPAYALMGGASVAGACVRWLRDNLGIIGTSAEVEALARKVDSTHGCYFVPALSGLFGTRWDPTARGIICGISQFTTKHHIARAALEAVCFQTREIIEAMEQDSGIPLTSLRVDGGMTDNDLLMQLQADLLQLDVVRPSMRETTAFGVAMAAGSAAGIGVWDLKQEGPHITTDTFTPSVTRAESDARYERWQLAVEKSTHWETASSTAESKDG
ncbi:hypothetical protein BaRGS_00013394 [Batillaria attramentaria]|uniref:Probable glycerol kinase n=1 Tax=Batillaria attramentaria TaxID=370345 RepID=A0ABD0L803_9CAEN